LQGAVGVVVTHKTVVMEEVLAVESAEQGVGLLSLVVLVEF